MKKTILNLVFILIVVCAVAYLLARPEQFTILKNISGANLFVLFLLSCLAVTCNAWQFRYLVMVFDIRLPFTEWFGLTVTNAMYNYFAPVRGGMVARALYLKKKHNFPLSEYASLLAGIYWFSFFICAMLALILGIAHYTPEAKFYVLIIAVSAALLIFTILIAAASLFIDLSRLPIPNARLRNILSIFSRGLSQFGKNKAMLLPICFFCLLFVFLSSACLYWAFVSLGISVCFTKVILVQAFLSISLVLSITPGNLGIKEGIIGLFAGVLDISVEQAIMGALLDRAVSLIIVFFFGFIYSKILLNDLSENE